MNPPIAIFTPRGKSATDTAPKFPTSRNEAAAPFSSLLERAVHQAPERNQPGTKSGRSRSDAAADAPGEDLRNDRRAPVRHKQKRDEASDDQSLAGACAVNGQSVNTEELSQVSTAPTESQVAAPTVAPTDVAQATESTDAETVVAVEADAAAVLTEVETSVVAASLLNGKTTVSSGADLATSVSPTNITPATNITDAETKTKNFPVVKVISEGMRPVENVLRADDKAAALPESPEISRAAATTSSAREAEILLANGLQADASTEAALNPAVAEGVAATAVAPEEARRTARAVRQDLTGVLENNRGTGTAKPTETMKTAIKKEEIAGLTQQLLPSTAGATVSTLPNLPSEARLGSSAVVSAPDGLNMAAKLSPAAARADLGGTSEPVELRAAAPVARISEVISREVRMFKRGGDDLVEVVLTPDSKTQISLRLQWREGQVEVQARCDLGDHQSLNQQWPQLQAAMAEHGVRLSHLSERVTTGFTEFFKNSNFSQPQGGERRATPQSNGADAMSPAGPASGKSSPAKSSARSNRLLESWA